MLWPKIWIISTASQWWNVSRWLADWKRKGRKAGTMLCFHVVPMHWGQVHMEHAKTLTNQCMYMQSVESCSLQVPQTEEERQAPDLPSLSPAFFSSPLCPLRCCLMAYCPHSFSLSSLLRSHFLSRVFFLLILLFTPPPQQVAVMPFSVSNRFGHYRPLKRSLFISKIREKVKCQKSSFQDIWRI